MTMQSDLDRLDLDRAQIFFKPGTVARTGLLLDTAQRVVSAMKDQFGRTVTADAKLVGRYVNVTVNDGNEKPATISFELPAELTVT